MQYPPLPNAAELALIGLRVLVPGPPRSHPIPTQTTVYTTAARTPTVPNTDRTLLKWPAVVNTTTRIMLTLDSHPTAGRMRPAASERRGPEQETHGQRDEHQYDGRADRSPRTGAARSGT